MKLKRTTTTTTIAAALVGVLAAGSALAAAPQRAAPAAASATASFCMFGLTGSRGPEIVCHGIPHASLADLYANGWRVIASMPVGGDFAYLFIERDRAAGR